MNKKRIAWLLILVIALAFAPAQNVHADAGPKPSMEFEFEYETDGPLTITDGELMECEDAACSQAAPLEQLGPQDFTCDPQSCSSLAYGYADQVYLVVTFSDGITRESKLFGKEHFEAYYQVTVRADDLVVEETGGRRNPMGYVFIGLIGGAVLAVGLLLGLVVTAIIIGVKGKGEDSGEGVKRVWFILAWVLGVVLLLVSGIFTSAIPITAAIELVLGWLYANWRNRRKRVLLTMILVANVVTGLALYTTLTAVLTDFSWGSLMIGEGLIWLVEAAVLYLPMRKSIRLSEAFLVSLVLNAVSFGVGLLLPF